MPEKEKKDNHECGWKRRILLESDISNTTWMILQCLKKTFLSKVFAPAVIFY